MGGYFGGIVGDNGGIMSGSKGGTISGCTASGTITGALSIGGIVGSTAGYFGSIAITDCEYSHAGGIAGISSGTRLIDCRNAGKITYIGGNSEPTEFSRGSGLGGITGAASNQVVEIRGCINEGAVAGTASVSGIAGACANNVTVSGCANFGPISGVVRDIGGIVGNNWAVIEACLNVGSVSGRDQTATGVGALPGHNVKIDGHFGTAKKCVYAHTEGTNPIGTDDGDLEGNPTDASFMGYQADGTLKEAVGGKTSLAEALSAVYPEGVPNVFMEPSGRVTGPRHPGAAGRDALPPQRRSRREHLRQRPGLRLGRRLHGLGGGAGHHSGRRRVPQRRGRRHTRRGIRYPDALYQPVVSKCKETWGGGGGGARGGGGGV